MKPSRVIIRMISVLAPEVGQLHQNFSQPLNRHHQFEKTIRPRPEQVKRFTATIDRKYDSFVTVC
jgi:hypothetical protein